MESRSSVPINSEQILADSSCDLQLSTHTMATTTELSLLFGSVYLFNYIFSPFYLCQAQ